MHTNTKEVVSASSVGSGTIVFVVLLVLKVLGKISMSWFLVITSILWVPMAISLAILIITGFFVGPILLWLNVKSNYYKRKFDRPNKK